MPFDKDKADRAQAFIENLKHTTSPWTGVKFTLLPWQRDQVIRPIFGTLKPDGYRQYNTTYVEVPKKNGKSELAAGVALYMTCADGEFKAQVYGAAADKQQASIVFDVAVDMVDQCPALKKRMKLIVSQKRMVYLPTKSFYQVLSRETMTKHGLNVHAVVFDELHAQRDRKLYDVLTKGSGDARRQPLFFFITTAGDDPDRTSIGWDVHKKALRVIENPEVDPTFYAVIYGIDEDDDWQDEANWYKANPSLGHTIQIDRVRAAAHAAKDDPSEERLFRQLRLDQWVKVKATKWLALSMWDAAAGILTTKVRESLKGRPCYGGLDLSSKIDLTAFILLFPPGDEDPVNPKAPEDWYVLPWFWVPEDNMAERVKRDHVPYDKWVKQGLIKTTPGNVIDYDFIKKTILDLAEEYQIAEVGYDPFKADQIALQLTDEGMTMVPVRQGATSMGPAMDDIEVLLRLGKKSGGLRHGGHPVLRWNFGNLEVKRDANENIRPVKDRKSERIDGFVALVNAMARARLHIDETSIYETRGVVTG